MGMNAIPSFVLKECAQQLSPLVFEFFLRITKTQQWPSQWKTSNVTPLHKSGSTSDVTNYRPISILPKLSIVFERLIFNFIYSRVCSKLKREQHGFMKHRSTVTQLISYLDKVYAAKDTTHDCLTVYFDVKKAFDSVSHGLLLHKLSSFGFDHNLLMLFQSYLTGRKQVVKVEGCFSSEAVVTSGVPQGSVLGPLLFSIFINDVADSIQHSEYFLYCDDLIVFSVSSIDKIQNDIDSLSSWSILNEFSSGQV